MKLALSALLLLIVGVVGYVAAGPFITLDQIRTGIVDQDSDRLARNIDFAVLRQNLKEQMNVQVMQKATSDLKDNPFGLLAAGMASKMVDGVIDTMITPAGLARIMEGKKQIENPPVSQEDRTARKEKILHNARHVYDAHDRFSIWTTDREGKELRFILGREGLSWKLINIIIPVDR